MRRARRPVMCCVDESAEAFMAAEAAAAVAGLLDAPLLLVHVVSASPQREAWSALGTASLGMPPDTERRECRAAEALLERVVGRLHLDSDTQTMVVRGRTGESLVEVAGAVEAEVIVLGTRTRGRVHRAILGSASAHVTAGASCPVIVIGHQIDHRAAAMGPIVCAVDESPEAERAAIVAASVADRLGRELVLVHVVGPGPALVAAPGEVGLVTGVLLERADKHGWSLLTAIAGTIGIRARLVVEPADGPVAHTLARVTRRERSACLVVGSRGRGPFRSALLDAVASSAASEIACPLVIVPAEMPPLVNFPEERGARVTSEARA